MPSLPEVKGAYIWVIAGGLLQVPLIQEAQRQSYKVLVTDRDVNGAGSKLADYFVPIDTYDIVRHAALAQALLFSTKPRPKAVLTAGADVGPTVSAVAETFDLPSETSWIVRGVHNKATMRRKLLATASQSMEHPVALVLEAGDTPERAMKMWMQTAKASGIDPYPIVIKAADNCASRGLSRLAYHQHYPEIWGVAMQIARAANKHSSLIVIEEGLSGKEYALDFFSQGRQQPLIFANGAYRPFYHRLGVGPGIEAGHVNPFVPDELLQYLCTDISHRLGVHWGPFKLDIIEDPRYGYCVLETACRLSGGYDHMYTAPIATGKDITRAMLELALGHGIRYDLLIPKWNKFAVACAPIYEPGRINGWKDLEQAGRMPGVHHIFLRPGNRIEPLADCAARPVFIIAEGQSSLEAWKRAVRAGKVLKPNYVDETVAVPVREIGVG